MIKNSIIEQIRTNKVLKAELQIVLDKSAPTIQRYLDENDIMLTTDAALTTIAKSLGIKKNTIVCCAVGDCSGCRTAKDQEAYRSERDFLMNIELNS